MEQDGLHYRELKTEADGKMKSRRLGREDRRRRSALIKTVGMLQKGAFTRWIIDDHSSFFSSEATSFTFSASASASAVASSTTTTSAFAPSSSFGGVPPALII